MVVVELHELTGLDQSAGIKRRQFSCAELTDHYLHRIADKNESVGAYITVIARAALDQAAELDRELARTDDPADLPPLFGTVVPVKDLDLVADVRCTFGSRIFADYVAPEDAAFVSQMRAAGLVIPGKTNTPEFGFPCYTENDLSGPARTPWDLERSAGGSSGGAAAAVAAGLASVAQGSDGGGSIRIPASVTGLVGIKPSRGRVSWAPNPEPIGELPVVGPLGRTVADAAALLDVLAGSALGDWLPPRSHAEGQFLAAARRPPGRLRVGRFADPILVETDVDAEVLDAYEAATVQLAALGHDVEDIERPFGPQVVPEFEKVWSIAAAALPLPPGSEDLLLPLTAHLRERGKRVTGVELARALTAMRGVARSAITATADYDVLLTPTLAQLPHRVGALRDDTHPAGDFEAQKAFTPFTAAFNVSGQPAMSLPFAISDEGLPIGIQIVGRPGDEATLISLAAQLEEAIGWQDRRPPAWD